MPTEEKALRVTLDGASSAAKAEFHSQVGHAASRLEQQLRTWRDVPRDASVEILVSPDRAGELGDEGFIVRTSSDSQIRIEANADAGAANGIIANTPVNRLKMAGCGVPAST